MPACEVSLSNEYLIDFRKLLQLFSPTNHFYSSTFRLFSPATRPTRSRSLLLCLIQFCCLSHPVGSHWWSVWLVRVVQIGRRILTGVEVSYWMILDG